MSNRSKDARIAGALYVLTILAGPFSLLYVPRVLFAGGDPATIARNVASHEMLLRLGILGDILSGVIFVLVVLALYRLLKGVNESLAVLMVIFGGLIPAPIFFLNALNWGAALELAHGATNLGAFSPVYLDSLIVLFLHLHTLGNTINSLFWGLWLFPFGVLVVKSRFLPQILGYLLLLEGAGYVCLSTAGILVPSVHETVFKIVSPTFYAEILIALWLLIAGAKEESPQPV